MNMPLVDSQHSIHLPYLRKNFLSSCATCGSVKLCKVLKLLTCNYIRYKLSFIYLGINYIKLYHVSQRDCVHPSVRPPIFPSVRPSVRPSVSPSVRPSVRSSVRPSVRPSIHSTVRPSIHPPSLNDYFEQATKLT